MFKSKRYKSSLFFSLVLILSLFLAPLSASAATELIVFSAASMTESLKLVEEAYKKAAPDVKIVFNLDSSGTLKTQIEHGAYCDVYISAGQKQMNQIDINADPKINTKKLDFLAEGTRFDLVSNKVVMIVPKGHNPNGIKDFKDALTDKVEIIALGNLDIPVGLYSKEIYESFGLWEKLKSMNKISYASTVKVVLSQVAEGSADCGLVFCTDAATSDAVDVIAEAPEGSHRRIAYPVAIMKGTKKMKAAADFIEFLKGPECEKIFNSVGFSFIGK